MKEYQNNLSIEPNHVCNNTIIMNLIWNLYIPYKICLINNNTGLYTFWCLNFKNIPKFIWSSGYNLQRLSIIALIYDQQNIWLDLSVAL